MDGSKYNGQVAAVVMRYAHFVYELKHMESELGKPLWKIVMGHDDFLSPDVVDSYIEHVKNKGTGGNMMSFSGLYNHLGALIYAAHFRERTLKIECQLNHMYHLQRLRKRFLKLRRNADSIRLDISSTTIEYDLKPIIDYIYGEEVKEEFKRISQISNRIQSNKTILDAPPLSRDEFQFATALMMCMLCLQIGARTSGKKKNST